MAVLRPPPRAPPRPACWRAVLVVVPTAHEVAMLRPSGAARLIAPPLLVAVTPVAALLLLMAAMAFETSVAATPVIETLMTMPLIVSWPVPAVAPPAAPRRGGARVRG